MSQFEAARRALGDLQEIWDFVAEDSFTADDNLVEDFYRTFQRLAVVPGMGHKTAGSHRARCNRFAWSASFTLSET